MKISFLLKTFFCLLLLISSSAYSQVFTKPKGCFAGTNGINPAVLSHPDARGVLLTEKWSGIEPSPGLYDFSNLDTKINMVRQAGLKYSLAIPAGAFGSPDWLIDSFQVGFHSFQNQNQNWRLPLWWDSLCDQKLSGLITELGNHYASDTLLSHIYVSQMTVNGVEGHLNGVDMTAFAADGFTNQKWISASKSTTYKFANAFPTKPLVFEVHEIGNDTLLPATIINDLYGDSSLCNRVGLGMWWISGKTTYQSNLINFIHHFKGDKYAQIIGRSDHPQRFKDGLFSSVFVQTKDLNIRYIEPWPFEFQNHTSDSLIHDFNLWADSNFASTDTCFFLPAFHLNPVSKNEPILFPNPTQGLLNLSLDPAFDIRETKIYNFNGQRV